MTHPAMCLMLLWWPMPEPPCSCDLASGVDWNVRFLGIGGTADAMAVVLAVNLFVDDLDGVSSVTGNSTPDKKPVWQSIWELLKSEKCWMRDEEDTQHHNSFASAPGCDLEKSMQKMAPLLLPPVIGQWMNW